MAAVSLLCIGQQARAQNRAPGAAGALIAHLSPGTVQFLSCDDRRFCLQAVMDSYMCLVHLTTGLVVDDLFGAFAGTAFMEVRFVMIPLSTSALVVIGRFSLPSTERAPAFDITPGSLSSSHSSR